MVPARTPSLLRFLIVNVFHLLKRNLLNYLFKVTFASVSLFWCSWSNCISSLPISYHPIFLFHLVLFGSSPVNSPWLFGWYFPAHLLNCLKKKMFQKEIASSRFLKQLPLEVVETYCYLLLSQSHWKAQCFFGREESEYIFLFLTISLCPPWCSVLFSSPRQLSFPVFSAAFKIDYYEPAGVLLTMSLLVASSSLANASLSSLLVCLHLFL